MLHPRQILVLLQQVFVRSVLLSSPQFPRHCDIEEWAFTPAIADGTATLCFHPEALPSWLGPCYEGWTEHCLACCCCCTGSTSKLSTWPHLPLGTLVLWQDALEHAQCQTTICLKAAELGFCNSSRGPKLALYPRQGVQTGCLRHGLMNRELVILALSAV